MTLSADETEWEQVADAINRRVEELGWSQAELARAADVSDATIRKLQNAEATRYHRNSLTKVASALGWPPDALIRIVRNGEAPTSHHTDHSDRQVLGMIADLQERLEALEEIIRARRQE